MSLEPPKSSTASHRLARHIEVQRDPRNGSVRVLIDGELFPYFLTGDGVQVKPKFGQPGEVTLTLVAERISLDDRFLEGSAEALGLDHDHEDDPAERVMPEATPCTKTPGCILSGPEHVGPCL